MGVAWPEEDDGDWGDDEWLDDEDDPDFDENIEAAMEERDE